MKKIKTLTVLLCIVCLLVGFTGCAQNSEVTLDYTDETAFETALENGDNLEGKTVNFNVSQIIPDSAFGYNLCAGKHLNFVSTANPDVKTGETVTAKVDKVESVAGSWVITYDKIEVTSK